MYSPYARELGLQKSLPERLFDLLYCEKPERNCEIMFLTENYRCHPEILQFSSYNFYGEGLKASCEQPSHPRLQPLLFYSVYGMEEAREISYINKTEVEEVVKRVKELANDWPEEWKVKDLSRIGVVSAYDSQVFSLVLLVCLFVVVVFYVTPFLGLAHHSKEGIAYNSILFNYKHN